MLTSYLMMDELSLQHVADILERNLTIELSGRSKKEITRCREYLDEKLKTEGEPIYGVNTGFGSLCNTVIPPQDLSQLQVNLLRSHACGTGEPVPTYIVQIMLLLKIQSLSFGNSGVTLATVNRLIDFFNNRIYPVVFEQGSLGASGDLAPLAHMSLPLIGEGELWVEQNGQWMRRPTLEVLQEKGWEPITLQAKEGLALINGTQFMGAYGLYVQNQLSHIWVWAHFIASISLDAFDARMDPFHPAIHKLRPHNGQVESARMIRYFLKDSQITLEPKTNVQDPYSFRCIPQVLGASFDAMIYFKLVITTEVNSVTDNPNIFPSEDLILSGGNFHGQPLALAFDFISMALSEIGNLSERRTYQLISGQRGLPAFLTDNPGLNSGFMIPQYTAASLVSQNKQLCTPSSVDSIVSSNGQEDHVSMGANGAVKMLKVFRNVEMILAIELMNAMQALEYRRPLRSSTLIEDAFTAYREKVPRLAEDRFLHDDMNQSLEFMRTYSFHTPSKEIENLNLDL